MIGSLLYLTANRPDISYVVGVCARLQAKSNESHLSSVKMIIRYVSRIVVYRLWYSNDLSAQLVGYCDDDWADKAEDRKQFGFMV